MHVGKVALQKPKPEKVDGRKHRKFWEKDEDNVLLQNFRALSYEEIAKMLPARTSNMVRERARTLKLIK